MMVHHLAIFQIGDQRFILWAIEMFKVWHAMPKMALFLAMNMVPVVVMKSIFWALEKIMAGPLSPMA